MADIELVIKIPEVFYEALRKTDMMVSGQRSGKTLMSVIYNAVANGTPLPDIAEDMQRLDLSMSYVLESDHRSFTNPESDNGWLFDKIIDWRKAIQPYIIKEEKE